MDNDLACDPEDLARTVDALKDAIDNKAGIVLIGKLHDDSVTHEALWKGGVPTVDEFFERIKAAILMAFPRL